MVPSWRLVEIGEVAVELSLDAPQSDFWDMFDDRFRQETVDPLNAVNGLGDVEVYGNAGEHVGVFLYHAMNFG